MPIIAATPRLLTLYADIYLRQLTDVNTGQPLASALKFWKDDDVKGTLYLRDQAFNYYPPALDSNAAIALTDGVSNHYADAGSLALVAATTTVPASITFDLPVSSTLLTTALSSLQSINAFIEIRLSLAGAVSQVVQLVSDPVLIRATSLGP